MCSISRARTPAILIRKNHAHGYDTDRNALVLKAYLDHSWPYGNDTFGFKETLVTFEKENDRVSKLRLDTGGGYNILSRQAESRK